MVEVNEIVLKKLNDEINEVRLELLRMQKLMKKYDLEEEIKDVIVEEIEEICLNEIRKLNMLSKNAQLTLADVKVLDIVHKNLIQARGLVVPKEEEDLGAKKATVGELLSIVEASAGKIKHE